MTPGRYDITIYQRATFSLDIKLPFNLSGHQVYAQLWDSKRRHQYANFVVQVTNPTLGELTLILPAAATRELKGKAEWDLLVVYPNGNRDYVLEGDVIIDIGYTDVP